MVWAETERTVGCITLQLRAKRLLSGARRVRQLCEQRRARLTRTCVEYSDKGVLCRMLQPRGAPISEGTYPALSSTAK